MVANAVGCGDLVGRADSRAAVISLTEAAQPSV